MMSLTEEITIDGEEVEVEFSVPGALEKLRLNSNVPDSLLSGEIEPEGIEYLKMVITTISSLDGDVVEKLDGPNLIKIIECCVTVLMLSEVKDHMESFDDVESHTEKNQFFDEEFDGESLDLDEWR